MQTRRGTLASMATLLTAGGLAFPGLVAAQQHADHEAMAMPASGIHADMLRDLDMVEEKFTSLAEAMTAHYAWRPTEGVRSVSEVFMHIAASNVYVPMVFDVAPPEAMEVASLQEAFGRMQEMEQVKEPAEVMKHLEHTFAHARHAIASVPEEALDDQVDLFGQPATKRAALILFVTHMHEHLGQAVAYARMNGVTPPWSGGG